MPDSLRATPTAAPATPPEDAAAGSSNMRKLLAEKRAAGAPWDEALPAPARIAEQQGGVSEPRDIVGPGGVAGGGGGQESVRQEGVVDSGDGLSLSTRSAPAGRLAGVDDDDVGEDDGYDEDVEDGEGVGDGSPMEPFGDQDFAGRPSHRRVASGNVRTAPRHRRRPSAVADAVSSGEVGGGVLLPPAIGQSGYDSPPTVGGAAEDGAVATPEPTEGSALLGTGAVPSMLLSPDAPDYGRHVQRPVSYGGITVPLDSVGESEGGRATFEVLTGAHGDAEYFSYTDDGDSQEDQMWMDSRDGSFDERNETSQRAAAIIGSGSAVVFVVVLAVVISGLSALAGVDVEQTFEVISDWPNGGTIPDKYGCLAPGGPSNAVSIPLAYNNIPRDTSALVIVVANPGAIKETGHDPVHWFVTDISPRTGGYGTRRPAVQMREYNGSDVDRLGRPWWIPANASANPDMLPVGARQRANFKDVSGAWFPPCSVGGRSSMYVLYIFAVDAEPVIANFQDARQILNRFSGVPTAKLAGYYRAETDNQNRTDWGSAAPSAGPSEANSTGLAGMLGLDQTQLDGIGAMHPPPSRK